MPPGIRRHIVTRKSNCEVPTLTISSAPEGLDSSRAKECRTGSAFQADNHSNAPRIFSRPLSQTPIHVGYIETIAPFPEISDPNMLTRDLFGRPSEEQYHEEDHSDKIVEVANFLKVEEQMEIKD